MKTKQKPKARNRKQQSAAADKSDALDRTRLCDSLQVGFEWALDVAGLLARHFPDDIERVERVRAFMRARMAGSPATVSPEDLLFAFAILMAAIDSDLGPIGLAAPWLAPPLTFHFPGTPQQAPQIPRILARPPTRFAI